MSLPCNRCTIPIEWGETFEGKKVPLCTRTEVYTFSGSDNGGTRKILRLGMDEAMARHICAVKVPVR